MQDLSTVVKFKPPKEVNIKKNIFELNLPEKESKKYTKALEKLDPAKLIFKKGTDAYLAVYDLKKKALGYRTKDYDWNFTQHFKNIYKNKISLERKKTVDDVEILLSAMADLGLKNKKDLHHVCDDLKQLLSDCFQKRYYAFKQEKRYQGIIQVHGRNNNTLATHGIYLYDHAIRLYHKEWKVDKKTHEWEEAPIIKNNIIAEIVDGLWKWSEEIEFMYKKYKYQTSEDAKNHKTKKENQVIYKIKSLKY